MALLMLVAACAPAADGNDANDVDNDVVNGGETGEQFRVGFAQKTVDSPYFIALVAAVERYAAERGWEVTVLTANDDTEVESENVDSLIAMGKDLIFLNSVDPLAAVPVINRAVDAGIPVINLDSAPDDAGRHVTTVYSNNPQNGRHVGLAYAAFLEAEGRGDEPIIGIILSGMMGNVAGQERRTGLFAGIIEGRTGVAEAEAWTMAEQFNTDLTNTGSAVNAQASFEIRGQGWGGWTEEAGLEAAEDLITANPDLNVVLGENDQMLFGAMTALRNAGIEGVDIVAAADGALRAYDYIRQGLYFGTGENSPWLVGRRGVEVAEDILVNGVDPASIPRIITTDAVAVTIDNVDERYEFGF